MVRVVVVFILKPLGLFGGKESAGTEVQDQKQKNKCNGILES
jgi:hypothetical protein